MKTSELIKKLKAGGCKLVRQGKGAHQVWFSPITNQEFIISKHGGKEVAKGTEQAILKQAGLK